jgi:nicotinate-nucleotide adenylyltransferase
MGEDNLNTFTKWKNYETLLDRYDIFVYPRIFEDKMKDNPLLKHSRIKLVENAPVMEISATFIRNAIKEGKNIKPLLDKQVWEYIDHNLFYKK